MISSTLVCESTSFTNVNLPKSSDCGANSPSLLSVDINCDTKSVVKSEAVKLPLKQPEEEEESDVNNFYAHRSLLITGGTGYIGKCLIFKLLNDCSMIKTIYVLLRKKGKYSFEERKNRYLNYEIFKYLRNNQMLNKLFFVEGSVDEIDLAISDDNLTAILQNVSVVFHSAASVNLSDGYEAVDLAANSNLVGTINVLNLCRKMDNLSCLVFVSTATVYPFKDVIEEKVYPINFSAQQFLSIVASNDRKKISQFLEKDQKQFPNPYTLTKALAENLCKIESIHYPICIVRPPIVSNAVQDPCKGWTYKMQAFNSMLLMWLMGLGRCLVWSPETTIQVAPVDYTCNVMIVGAIKTAQNWIKFRHTDCTNVPVFNVVPSESNQMTWKKLLDISLPLVYDAPSIKALRWPPTQLISPRNTLKFVYSIIFEHIIFAIFVDTILLCTGKSPRVISLMLKMYRTIKSVKWFLVKRWKYCNTNYLELEKQLSEIDRKTFPMSMHDMDWNSYVQDGYYGIRRFVLHEKDSQIKSAIARMRKITILTNLAIVVSLLLLLFVPIILFLLL